MTKRDTLNIIINLEKQNGNYFLEGSIIPGNRYFRLEGKSYYFNRNMPLEINGREGAMP